MKTFLIQYRNIEGRTRRLVLGQYGRLTTENARLLARKKLTAVAEGTDPSADRHGVRVGMSVKEVCDWYLEQAEAGRLLGRNRRPIKASSTGHLRWVATENHPVRFSAPPGTMLNCNEVHFWPEAQPLNEFGFFYVALYILGNYARYYPDRWMLDVDRGSPLALAAESLMRGFTTTAPLLALTELARMYFIAHD